MYNSMNYNGTIICESLEDVCIENIKIGQQILIMQKALSESSTISYSNLKNMFFIKRLLNSIYYFQTNGDSITMYDDEEEIYEIENKDSMDFEGFLSIDNVKIQVISSEAKDSISVFNINDLEDHEIEDINIYKDVIQKMSQNNDLCFIQKEVVQTRYNQEQINFTFILQMENDCHLIVELKNQISKNGWNKYATSMIVNFKQNLCIETDLNINDLKKLEKVDKYSNDLNYRTFIDKYLKIYNYDIKDYIRNNGFLNEVILEMRHEEDLKHIFSIIYQDDKYGFKAYRSTCSWMNNYNEIRYTNSSGSYDEISNCRRKAKSILNFKLNSIRSQVINPYNGEILSDDYSKDYEDFDSMVLVYNKPSKNKDSKLYFIKLDELYVPVYGMKEVQYVKDKYNITKQLVE